MCWYHRLPALQVLKHDNLLLFLVLCDRKCNILCWTVARRKQDKQEKDESMLKMILSCSPAASGFMSPNHTWKLPNHKLLTHHLSSVIISRVILYLFALCASDCCHRKTSQRCPWAKQSSRRRRRRRSLPPLSPSLLLGRTALSSWRLTEPRRPERSAWTKDKKQKYALLLKGSENISADFILSYVASEGERRTFR